MSLLSQRENISGFLSLHTVTQNNWHSYLYPANTTEAEVKELMHIAVTSGWNITPAFLSERSQAMLSKWPKVQSVYTMNFTWRKRFRGATLLPLPIKKYFDF